jgi:hypothetical protein
MARSRNIKPGFFTNDVLGELPALTRLLFAGLWTICDRDGRVEDRPKKIRAEVLPYDQCDPEEMLQALHNSGFIVRYEAGGKRLIQVLAWAEHQNPHVKEAPSSLPAPDKHQTSTVQAPDKQSPSPEPAGLIPSSLIPDSLNSDSVPNGTARKRAASFDPCAIDLPQWLEREAWVRWCKDRATRRKAITEDAARLQLKKLGEYVQAGTPAEKAIDHAIESGHQGFYLPLTSRTTTGNRPASKHSAAAAGFFPAPQSQYSEVIDV